MADSAVFIPNVPGMKPNRVDRSAKSSTAGFRIHHGVAFPKERPIDPQVMAAMTETAIADAQRTAVFNESITRSSGSHTTQWLAFSGQTLQFDCHTNEQVHVGIDEDYRVRRCNLFYHLADDTLEVNEIKTENSGLPQGALIKRHQVQRSDGSGLVGVEDLQVGGSVSLYGRDFYITDCNPTTRAYLESRGIDAAPAAPAPADPYSTLRADFMSRETGADPSIPRNQRKSEIKTFMEATLGNTIDTSGRAGFMEHGTQVLRFDAVYPNKELGEMVYTRFTVHYFLADGTVEVCEVHTPNDGRDPFTLLVKRMKLPLDHRWGHDGRTLRDEYVHWADLAIGSTVNVFTRALVLIDADGFTRRFFESQGRPLDPPIMQDVIDTTVPIAPREYPPHNGWGGEEDSLQNCLSLIPKAPKDRPLPVDASKVLRWEARLVTDVADDKIRRFVISFFTYDDTMMVAEPPQRNTGIVGGRFLERGKYKKQDGSYFEKTDFNVGENIVVNASTLNLTDVDEGTLAYMENRPRDFPLSDAPALMEKLKNFLRAKAGVGGVSRLFSKYDDDGSGEITIDEFGSIVTGIFPDLPQQGVVTLARMFDHNRDGSINVSEFRQTLEDHTMQRKVSVGADISAYGDNADSSKAASAATELKRHLIFQFCTDLQNKGGHSELVRCLSGKTLSSGDTLTKSDFTAAVTHAETQDMSDSVNINLTPENAALVADHFFRDSDVLTYSEFMNEVAVVTQDMATTGRVDKGGGGQSRTH